MKAKPSRIASSDWPRVLRLLDQALDLPPAERDRWVHKLSLPEPLLATLQRLLAQDLEMEAQDFLASMPPLLPARHTLASPGTAWCAGAIAGPWRLLRPLGQGGMSVVWLAERADGQMRRSVALKLPREGSGGGRLAQRLMRERRILAALEHPHIARLYDVGLTDSGLPYLAMEHVEGQTLLAHADEMRLSVASRVALFQQVLSAVQFAHGRLVLHRDIKPTNILVTPAGQAKLLDFGIAKLMAADDDEPADETDITRGTGHQLTPGYASPEQWLGKTLGVVSDVYSLGVVLHELLAGCRPHATGPLPRASLQQAVLNDEPLPPSQRRPSIATAALRSSTPSDLARSLKGDLDAVCLKALAREPADRYASADAMSADLTRWQRGDPVSARTAGAWYFASKFVQRHRLGVGLASLALVALLSVGTVALWQGQAARQEAQRAALARDFMLGLFAQTSPERLNGVRVTSSQMLERGRQNALQMVGEPQLQAELLAGIGQAQLALGDLRSADAALKRAALLFRSQGQTEKEAAVRLARLELAVEDYRWDTTAQPVAELKPLLAPVMSDRLLRLRWLFAGGVAHLAQAAQTGLAMLQQCIDEAEMTNENEAGLAYRAQLRLAHYAAGQGNTVQAQVQLQEATQMLAQQAGASNTAWHQLRASVVRNDILGYAGQFAEMLREARSSVATCESLNSDPERRRCQPLQLQLAWAHMRLGDPVQALETADRMAWTLNQQDESYARFATVYVEVWALAAMGDSDPQALPVQVLADLLRADSTVPIPVRYQVPGLDALAQMRLRAGDTAGAQALLARAEALIASAPPHSLVAESSRIEFSRALVAQARGEHGAALLGLGALCKPDAALGMMPTLNSLNCVRSLVATGQQQRAVSLVAASIRPMIKQLGPDAPTTQRAIALLAELQSPGYQLPAWNGGSFFIGGIR